MYFFYFYKFFLQGAVKQFVLKTLRRIGEDLAVMRERRRTISRISNIPSCLLPARRDESKYTTPSHSLICSCTCYLRFKRNVNNNNVLRLNTGGVHFFLFFFPMYSDVIQQVIWLLLTITDYFNETASISLNANTTRMKLNSHGLNYPKCRSVVVQVYCWYLTKIYQCSY